MLLRITLLLLVVTCIGLLREIEAFLPILPVKITGINIEASSVGLRKNEYLRSADHFEVFTKRDEAAVSVGDSNCNPPGFLEPGGAPAVAFSQDVDMDIIYRDAIKRTLLWVALAGMFGAGIWSFVDSDLGEEFFAGYLVEQSLSVDNLFVFLLLFDFFKVPIQSQDKILNWGIYGAIVMRAVMIGLGAVAIENFRPILLVFASILVYSSGKILIGGDDDEEEDMNENAIIKLSKKLIDSTETMDGDKFFTIVEGVKKATPLFLCMIAVEISDVVFAVDSIPAVFGVTEVSRLESGKLSLLACN
jgi:predicted tellurium resistance membrane protein TerC